MTTSVQDLAYEREDLSSKFPGNIEHHKGFFKSSLIPPPPTLIYFLTDEYSLEDKQSNPGM